MYTLGVPTWEPARESKEVNKAEDVYSERKQNTPQHKSTWHIIEGKMHVVRRRTLRQGPQCINKQEEARKHTLDF